MHPAKENIGRTIGIAIVIVLAGVFSAFYMGHSLFAVFAIVVLFLGLGQYFLPTTYGTDENGVIKKIAGQKWGKPWSYFLRHLVFEDGIFLSPMPKPSRLDKFRGWFLPVTDKKIRDFIILKMNEKQKDLT